MSIEARIPEAWRHPAFNEMRTRIETLEEENRQLKEALRPAIAFPARWRVIGQRAELLATLYARKGCVPYETLRLALFDREERHEGHVATVLYHLRRKVGRFGVEIETITGIGLQLTPESRAIIEAALAAPISEARA